MKTKLSDDDHAFLGTINLALTVVILAAIGFAIYWLLSNDLSDIFDTGENAGEGLWGAISGAASGFLGGAWRTGTDIGNRWNPVRTWQQSSRRDDGKWWTFW